VRSAKENGMKSERREERINRDINKEREKDVVKNYIYT
jgi:hypothetical protein